MTVGQKASVSLLIATVLAAGFAVLAYSGLFTMVETRFFDARVRTKVDSSLDSLASSVDTYHRGNIDRFGTLLQNDYVRRSFLPNQSAQDVFDRESAFGQLQEQTPSLSGARFIDADGKRIHFSTFPADVSKTEELRTVYRNYGDAKDEPYDTIGVKENSSPSVIALGARRAFAYVYPFVDGFDVYRGTAIFYVTFNGLLENLVRERHIAIGEDVQTAGAGVVFGAPSWGGEALLERIAQAWTNGLNAEPVPVGASGSSGTYILFMRNVKTGPLGKLVPSSWFEFPVYMQWLLLAAFFVSIYLMTFLLFNIRQDGITMLSSRIKRLQIGLVEEYLDSGGTMDPAHWRRELESRRFEVSEKIKKNAGRIAKKRSAEVDALINKGWDDIIAVLAGRQPPAANVPAVGTASDITRIETLLREALSRGNFTVNSATPLVFSSPTNLPAFPQMPVEATAGPAGEVEELAEAESAEEAEELAEVEDLAEAESAEEAEEPAEVEDLAEVESAEEVEELAEVEDLAEAESAEEVEELAEVEDLAEAESAEEAEELAEIEDLAEAESAEEAEELAEVEDLAEAESAEEAEELAEIEDLAEAESAEEAEELAEIEDLAEVESAEEVEELEEVSEVEDLTEDMIHEDILETENWGSLSAEAMAFAASSDEDIPLIPESLGLALVEEINLADVQKYISGRLSDEQIASNLEKHVREDDGLRIESPRLSEADALEELEEVEEFAEEGLERVPLREMAEEQELSADAEAVNIIRSDAAGITEESGTSGLADHPNLDDEFDDGQFDDSPVFSLSSPLDDADDINIAEPVSQDKVTLQVEQDDYLYELEFDLFLDALDLSGLENYRDEEGFLELDMTEFSSHSTISDAVAAEEESEDLAGQAEFAMLSDEDRERMEELQVQSSENEEEASDVVPIDYFPIYRRHELFNALRMNFSVELSELESIGEGEPELLEMIQNQLAASEDDAGDDEHPPAPVNDGVIAMKDGLFTLNPSGISRGLTLDAGLKALADEVLSKSRS